MQELTTDLWSLLLPEEWFAEQDGETILVVDEDEVSIIEITTLIPDKGVSVKKFIADSIGVDAKSCELASLPAKYQEFEEDDMFWREWYCEAGKFILLVSHGTDSTNRHMDDGAVDEILSTLLLTEEE